MRTLLIGRRHGKKDWELIAGPNISTSEQLAKRSEIMAEFPVHDNWAEVEIHQENPVKGRLTFLTKEEAKAQAEASKKADEELAKENKASLKRAKKLSDEKAAARLKDHQERVAELNKQHDEFRKALNPK